MSQGLNIPVREGLNIPVREGLKYSSEVGERAVRVAELYSEREVNEQ